MALLEAWCIVGLPIELLRLVPLQMLPENWTEWHLGFRHVQVHSMLWINVHCSALVRNAGGARWRMTHAQRWPSAIRQVCIELPWPCATSCSLLTDSWQTTEHPTNTQLPDLCTKLST